MTNTHQMIFNGIVYMLGFLGIKKGCLICRRSDGVRGYIGNFEGDSITETKFEFTIYARLSDGSIFIGSILDFLKTHSLSK